MATTFSHSTSLTKMIIILEFFLVAYLIYSLTKNVYNSYVIDSYIENFRLENLQIEEENKTKNADYLYFTSQEYIDKIAKQNLGLINPGEEIIVLSPEVLGNELDVFNEDLPEYAVYDNSDIKNQWWNLFFEN